MDKLSITIIGAGPAGLTAAYELAKIGIYPVVLEKADKVGGIARTEIYHDYRFDIGGHRFFTKVEEVQQLWLEILGNDFIKVPRLSRIYYQGKFFDYPLSFKSTLSNLGFFTSFLILWSYLKEKVTALLSRPDPQNFEDWATHCFGERLYKTFFKTYTEKVWGIPCSEIQAEWAKQRIKGLSLKSAVLNLLLGKNNTKSMIKEFDYPILGPGMMWERCQEKIEAMGGEVRLNTSVVRLEHNDNCIVRLLIDQGGETIALTSDQFISSMPITTLIHRLDPPPPVEVIKAADSLSYRDFLIVPLIVDAVDLFPDNWLYIHSPDVRVGRIQNFKNWSAAMVPDPSKTCLGMEYFCSRGDDLWNLSNAELIALATEEIVRLGLAHKHQIEDGTVLRQPRAYPVYDRDYLLHLGVIRDYLSRFTNLQTIGRNGMHRYNNQDHSMLTAILAAKNLVGETHSLWDVNTERSYYEEFTQKEWLERQEQISLLENTEINWSKSVNFDIEDMTVDLPIEETVVIVSGLPRSGTSMMMQMLAQGGFPIMTDGVRKADKNNPKGYFEHEKVKQLGLNNDWLPEAQGKVVKIVAPLLPKLPVTQPCRIIFMQRHLAEVVASQGEMLQTVGQQSEKFSQIKLAQTYIQQLEQIEQVLQIHPNIGVLTIDYQEALDHPEKVAFKVNQFLGRNLDERGMVAAVDPSLQTQKKSRLVRGE